MDIHDELKEDAYLTYNGLNRPALVAGVPLMILLFTGLFAVLAGFPAIYFFKLKGLIIPAGCFLFLFMVKLVCEDDPNALRIIRLNIMGFLLKVKHNDLILGYSSIR